MAGQLVRALAGALHLRAGEGALLQLLVSKSLLCPACVQGLPRRLAPPPRERGSLQKSHAVPLAWSAKGTLASALL